MKDSLKWDHFKESFILIFFANQSKILAIFFMIFVKPMKRSLPFYWHQTHLKSAKFFLFQKNVNRWRQSWQPNIWVIIYFPCCFVLLHKRHFIKKDSIYLFTLLFTFSRSLLRTTSSCSLRHFLKHMFTSINIRCDTLNMSAKKTGSGSGFG